MTAASSSAPPAWSWDDMVECFRGLGGAIQNIQLGNSGTAPGLYAIDPRKPVLLRVPRNLLVRVEDVEFSADGCSASQSADVPEPQRRFFDRYQHAFSWGAGGKLESAAFIEAVDALPREILQLLGTELAFAYILEGEFAERVQKRFLRSRQIRWQRAYLIAPLLELARHDASGLRFERGTHLQLQGYAHGEVKVRNGMNDPYSAFCRFGCVGRESVAFSLAIEAEVGDIDVRIGRDMDAGTRRGKDRIPRAEFAQSRVVLSHLLVGNKKNPRLPRGACRALFRQGGIRNPDEAFEQILCFNTLRFIKLLRTLEPYDGQMISALRTMARYQLEAMSYHIGSRELAPAASE